MKIWNEKVRRISAVCLGLIILALVNHSIYGREQLLKEGNVVLLKLAPVDPRSLMQGDYMALRFEVAGRISSADKDENKKDGHVVLALDERFVGTFNRLDDGMPLNENEIRMRYRVRNGRTKFGTNAFFFQEGDAELYTSAKYGEFRVDDKGEAILTRMRDENLVLLGSEPRETF